MSVKCKHGAMHHCVLCELERPEARNRTIEAGQAPAFLPHDPTIKIPGRKDDHDKLRWDLVPWASMNEVVRVLDHGAQKYGVDNWQLVMESRRRYFAAALRHITAWQRGEPFDPETGLHHLAHAICCLLFLIWLDVPANQYEADARRAGIKK